MSEKRLKNTKDYLDRMYRLYDEMFILQADFKDIGMLYAKREDETFTLIEEEDDADKLTVSECIMISNYLYATYGVDVVDVTYV